MCSRQTSNKDMLRGNNVSAMFRIEVLKHTSFSNTMSPTAYSGFRPPAALVTVVLYEPIYRADFGKETHKLWYQYPTASRLEQEMLLD